MKTLARNALAAACALALAAPALADGIIDNVNGITLDAQGKVVRFTGMILTPDGRVVRLVSRGEKLPRKLEWRVDLKGKTVLPGLIDAHGHVMELGQRALQLDLSDTRSLDEARAKIRAYADANPNRAWILGGGWNQETWGLGRFPTAAELDNAVGDRPVWLARVDGHAGWANSAAMREAHVTAQTPTPPGGRIEKGAGGAPAGVFVDAAKELIEKVVPPPLPRDRDQALLAAVKLLLGFGITATADMGTSVEDWLTYRRAGDAGQLRVRILSYAAGVAAAAATAGNGPSPWLYGDKLRMVGVKLYADGALGSRGAWLKAPYADAAGQKGLSLLNDTQLNNLMSRASMDHFQVAVHAIGDAANAEVLGAIDEMAQTYTGDRRWRIEHAQIVDPADLPRFGRNGIVVSMQPVHQSSDWKMAEARLGPDRLGGAYAWRSMLNTGAKLAFGSDYPVESPNPFPGWAVAITREDAQGQPAGGWRPQERLTREEALAAFTIGGAYAGFAEDRIGRLAPGFRADFIVLDADPLLASPGQLRGMTVRQTYVAGQKVFDRDSPPEAAPAPR